MQKISSIDDIMKNYPLESDSAELSSDSFENHKHIGGNDNDNNSENENDVPNGGFPPIYSCKKQKPSGVIDQDQPIKREYKTEKSMVSIKDILDKRRKATPFI